MNKQNLKRALDQDLTNHQKKDDIIVKKPKKACLSTRKNDYSRDGCNYSFRKPQEIGCFSVDKNRGFCDDAKNKLKVYYNPPPSSSSAAGQPSEAHRVRFDLKVGFSSFDNRDKVKPNVKISPVPIDLLLKWIVSKKHVLLRSDQQSKNLLTDFISWRGILTRILCTPYETRDAWIIAVSKFNGTFYLCEFETEKKLREALNPEPRHEQMSYWGYKFEHYVTCERKNGEVGCPEDPSTPINNSECFNTVLRSRLNSHSLIFSAEVDCVDPARTDRSQDGYIELKTSREFTHPRQKTSFKRYKLLKWWAQSYLAGINRIICGFRNDDGIVERLQSYEVDNLPKMAQEVPGSWRPDVCMKFYDAFLSFVKETVIEDDPKVVHLFRFDPDVRRDEVFIEEQRRDSPYVFLPDWYIHEMT
ncbi:decapping and exoribonuclease protein-like [Tubulanus polymorphus]|uniref:decapping and exoribonuclease protein-like n=1 Tax=Tubulanus polymorphus TaxID=672921 RepID=UPI003DA3BC86